MKFKRLISKKRYFTSVYLWYFFLLFGWQNATGQIGGGGSNFTCGWYKAVPPTGSNPDSLVLDRFGNQFDFATLQAPWHGSLNSGMCPASGYFAPTFYGNVPQNATPVICQVLNDVSGIVLQRVGQNDCGQTVMDNVSIQIAWISFSAPDPDVVAALGLALPIPTSAGIGTPFYSNPLDNNCHEVALDRPFIKVNGGKPEPVGVFDGRILINADYNWNLNNTLPTGGFPNQLDLYSVLLHETMHLMGFASRMGFADAYSLWDQTLRVVDNYQSGGGGANPVRVIENPSGCVSNCWQTIPGFSQIALGSCNPNNQGGADVVVGDASIAPIAGTAINPTDPDAFNGMLSHLSTNCSGQNINYVMQSGLPSNTARRNMTDPEKQIFCALGYEVQLAASNCPGCYNIAHWDREFSSDAACCFKSRVVCAGGSIEITNEELLCNDITNGPAQIITRVWAYQDPNIVPVSNGTGWVIQVPPNYANNVINFNYTVTGCDCRQHNMRFDIRVDQQCPPCDFSSDVCDNLLCVSDFENFTNTIDAIETRLGWPVFFEGYALEGSPDIVVSSNGNHYLHVGNYGFAREAVNLELNKCIEPGCSLELSMDLSAENTTVSRLEVWGSQIRPCDPTMLGPSPIANNCGQGTTCSPGVVFDPICVFPGEFTATSTSMGNDDPNFTGMGPFTWTNNTAQNVCFLTLVPSGGAGIFLDNIEANIECEPVISCDNDTPDEICVDDIAQISFQVCAPVLVDCQSVTLVTPSVILPIGWTLNGPAPGTFTLAEGHCQEVAFEVQMPAGTPLGTTVTIGLNGTATGICTTVDWSCEATVTVIECDDPPEPIFACPCPPSGLNIDASSNNPLYDASLGGVLYSALEAAFNYDQDDDGIIELWEHNNCIAINGRLIIDQDVEIQVCDNIQMQPCAEIVVGETSQITRHATFDDNTIYSCVSMWKGITVAQHSHLTFRDNIIRDAEYAIRAIGSKVFQNPPTKIYVTGNTFTNNHVGVYLPQRPVKSVVEHIPFVNNTFNTEIGVLLRPLCTIGLPDYNNMKGGFAGIISEGIQFTAGLASGGGNKFNYLRNGIIGRSAPSLSVYFGEFNHIKWGSTGPEAPPTGFGGACVWTTNGNLVVEKSTMLESDWGVYTNNTSTVRVKENIMRFMWVGVETYRARLHEINDNPVITFKSRGIYCKEVNGFLGNHRIQRNIGLEGLFSGPISDPQHVDPNTFHAAIAVENILNIGIPGASIKSNIFNTIGSFWHGVHVAGTGDWDIDGNEIYFNLSTNAGAGFRLENTHGNYLYGNKVVDGSSFKQSAGYSLADGTLNKYCCNEATGNKIGARFLGTCSTTEWRTSDLNNLQTSLHCAPGTAIGLQLSYGDLFKAGTGTAVHEGEFNFVTNSQFEVLDMNQPHWPVAISTPNTTVPWFTDLGTHPSCGGSNTVCTAPAELLPDEPGREGDIENTDLQTATNAWAGDAYGNTMQYESSRRLYERMMEIPGVYGQNAATDAFFAAAQAGKTGDYYTAERAVKDIELQTGAITAALEQNLLALETQRLKVATILQALATATTATDSSLIFQQANAEMRNSQSTQVILAYYEALAAQQRSVKAADALSNVNNLVANTPLETNRRTVLRVYMESIGSGNIRLTTQQLADITPIAEDCPLDGGSAVFMARALYRLNIPKEFVDDNLCVPVGARQERGNAAGRSSSVKLIPNPAHDRVLVDGIQASADAPALLQLTTINGVVCQTIKVLAGSIQLSTLGLPDGMYLCTLRSFDGKTTTLKLVVQH